MKVAPAHGFLRISMVEEDHYHGSQENPIQSFSQDDINKGHIQYVQIEHGYVNDSFSLDVTNGVLTIHDLVVVVDIIPLHIPLEVSNMTLIEGSSKALTQDIIKVVNQHFHGLQIFYLVIDGPHHGRIEHSRIPGVPIPSFTRAQVSYFHSLHLFTLFLSALQHCFRKYISVCVLIFIINVVKEQHCILFCHRLNRGSYSMFMMEVRPWLIILQWWPMIQITGSKACLL